VQLAGLFLGVSENGRAEGSAATAFWCLDAFLATFERQFGTGALDQPHLFWGQWRAYLDLHAHAAASGEQLQHLPPPTLMEPQQQQLLLQQQQQRQLLRAGAATAPARVLKVADVDALLLALAMPDEPPAALHPQHAQAQHEVQHGASARLDAQLLGFAAQEESTAQHRFANSEDGLSRGHNGMTTV